MIDINKPINCTECEFYVYDCWYDTHFCKNSDSNLYQHEVLPFNKCDKIKAKTDNVDIQNFER